MTGKQFELTVLAKSGWEKHYQFLDKEQMCRVIRYAQPTDPRYPPKPLGQKLMTAVQSALKAEWRSRLKLYTALGSPLDDAGIDGFFELEGAMATFDLTINLNKKKKGADFIVYHLDFLDEERLKKLGEAIAGWLETRQWSFIASEKPSPPCDF
jgi:hypothetical protein